MNVHGKMENSSGPLKPPMGGAPPGGGGGKPMSHLAQSSARKPPAAATAQVPGGAVQPPRISPSGDLGQAWPGVGGPGGQGGMMMPGMALPGGLLQGQQKGQQQQQQQGGGLRNVAALDSFQMFKKQAHEREARVSEITLFIHQIRLGKIGAFHLEHSRNRRRP